MIAYEDATVTVHTGDCLDVLRELPDASVDAVVTDPPYGLEFMGREWDRFREETTTCATQTENAQTTGATGAPGASDALGTTANNAATVAASGAPTDPARAASATIVEADAIGGFQDGNGGNAYSRSRVRTNTQRHGGDAKVANRGFGQWCELWTAECLRVLKPGGHLLAFGGTRTWHRLACAVEDAGFEVRDSIAWLHSQGFPKNLNVSAALDAARCRCATKGLPYGGSEGVDPLEQVGTTDLPRVSVAVPQVADQAEGHPTTGLLAPVSWDSGCGSAGVDSTPGSAETRPVCAEVRGEQPGMEGRGNAQAAEGQLQGRQVRPLPSGIPADGADGRLHHGAPSGDGPVDRALPAADGGREPQGSRPVEQPAVEPRAVSVERGSQAWGGWPVCERCSQPVIPDGLGTAAKPAFEPIVVARKPLGGSTVAANVLRHGTGALNVDACRIGDEVLPAMTAGQARIGTFNRGVMVTPERTGRWPANVVLDESQAAELDTMSGDSASKRSAGRNGADAAVDTFGLNRTDDTERGHTDSGGASRFFYVAREDNHPCPSTNAANTAATPSHHPNETADSAPNDAATSASHEAAQAESSTAPCTTDTATGSRLNGATATPTNPSTAAESSPASPLEKPSQMVSRARYAASLEQTDTTTTTPNPSPSAGSADHTTSSTTPTPRALGVQALPLDELSSRFTYTAKADAGERVRVGRERCDCDPELMPPAHETTPACPGRRTETVAHPTVKPLALMRWLVRLVTPPDGTVLEPFAGSGTTVEACILEGFRCIAIEREPDYLPLILQRINRRRDPVAAVKGAGEDGGLFDLLSTEEIA